jgi:hypothetical protein
MAHQMLSRVSQEIAVWDEQVQKREQFSGIPTVRIIIGIFQHKEDVTRLHRDRMLDISSLTEVGPFFSKNQALSWMQELHSQIDNSELAHIPESENNQLKWYGFTFEE